MSTDADYEKIARLRSEALGRSIEDALGPVAERRWFRMLFGDHQCGPMASASDALKVGDPMSDETQQAIAIARRGL